MLFSHTSIASAAAALYERRVQPMSAPCGHQPFGKVPLCRHLSCVLKAELGLTKQAGAAPALTWRSENVVSGRCRRLEGLT